VLADTSGGAFTVTLPAAPSAGDQCIVADAGANFGTNNLTVGRNGSTIGGLAQDLVIDITGVSVQLVYDGTTWEVYAQIGGNGGTAVTLDGVQTLTNKTISGSSNTLTNISLTTAVTGTLPAANGGTGITSPGTSGNVLTSNGTAWTSAAPVGGVTQQLFTAGSALTGTFAKGANITGTYTRTSPSTTVTVTVTNTLAAGDRVYLDYTSGTAADGWQTVISATGADFTVPSSTNTTTSGNVTVGVPIVVTVNDHGLSTGNSVFVDFSGTYTDASLIVYQATTNTFQVQSGTTTQNTSGTVTLPQISQSQTWTKPTGCKSILVELVGGGGNFLSCGSSGAGAGYSSELIDVTSVSTVSLTVGFAGKIDSYSGGTSSFGAYLTATGGGNAVAVGVGSNGTINQYGFDANTPLYGRSILGSANNAGVTVGYGVGAANGADNARSGVIIVTEYY
jgi:hypothetical protein